MFYRIYQMSWGKDIKCEVAKHFIALRRMRIFFFLGFWFLPAPNFLNNYQIKLGVSSPSSFTLWFIVVMNLSLQILYSINIYILQCYHYFCIYQYLQFRSKNSKWVWSGNTTITNCRQPCGTARKSHSTITRHQEDLSKAISSLFPIKMIALLEWT